MTNVRHVKNIPVIFHLARFQKKWLEAPLTDSQEPPTTSRINKGEVPMIDCLTNGVFRTSRPNGSKKEHEVKQRGPCYTGIQSGSQRVTKKKIPNKITKNRDRKSHCHVHQMPVVAVAVACLHLKCNTSYNKFVRQAIIYWLPKYTSLH